MENLFLNNLNFDNQHLSIKNDLQLVVENENDSVKQALYLLSNLKNPQFPQILLLLYFLFYKLFLY